MELLIIIHGGTEMKLRQEQETKGGNFDRMIQWLDGEDEVNRERAVTILCQLGQPVVELLIQEAMATDKRPAHRLRILDIVQRIGEPLGVGGFLGILPLLQDPTPSIRQKVAEMLVALRPGNSPDAKQQFA
jgi:hypothetical protein